MRNCKGKEEVAAMEAAAAVAEEKEEIGVRMTRARAKAEAATGKLKKRTLSRRELNFSSPLKHRRRITFTAENSTSPAASENSNDQHPIPSSDQATASCYSTNTSSELAELKIKIIDLEEEEASSVEIATSSTYDIKIRESKTTSLREFRGESVELEATTARPSEASSFHRSTEIKMPSEAELEDFFSKAEKDLQKQFAEKYNFDIVKEEPREGRYEWFPVNHQ